MTACTAIPLRVSIMNDCHIVFSLYARNMNSIEWVALLNFYTHVNPVTKSFFCEFQ